MFAERLVLSVLFVDFLQQSAKYFFLTTPYIFKPHHLKKKLDFVIASLCLTLILLKKIAVNRNEL